MSVLGCCGGSRDPVQHREDCPSIVLAALSWIEDNTHGERHRVRGERAFDLILAERESLREQLAICAADTTAPDLAQEVEFLKAEKALMQERIDNFVRQEWTLRNRAEVAERGHKACLAREMTGRSPSGKERGE